ncbi:MAG: flavin reductase family protein [Halieaceae bacterium]|jgi:flavin reductase (DIM6/NTAB) family NADH-FMN oxidoreductase RutF|nr:flavin reductase family protein [Halieaceae bacterium]
MSFSSREFRDALGCFATGVCVITGQPDDGAPFGMTVNSFASVSLDPPLILWSLQNDSEMFDTFTHCKRWAVNILRADQQALSGRYALKGEHDLDPAHFEAGSTGMPVLPNTLVSFECEEEARHNGGDHVILVARVLAMSHREAGSPLVFCSGAYAELAG